MAPSNSATIAVITLITLVVTPVENSWTFTWFVATTNFEMEVAAIHVFVFVNLEYFWVNVAHEWEKVFDVVTWGRVAFEREGCEGRSGGDRMGGCCGGVEYEVQSIEYGQK